jgi:hypothetical protein
VRLRPRWYGKESGTLPGAGERLARSANDCSWEARLVPAAVGTLDELAASLLKGLDAGAKENEEPDREV